MRSKTRRHGGLAAAGLGLLLMLAGAAALLSAPDELEYVIPAPAAQSAQQGDAGADGPIAALYKEATEKLGEMTDVLSAGAVCARAQGVELAKGTASARTTAYAVGAGYFDVRHETLREGRFITETDVRRGERVAVVSDAAAIALFPGADPLGQKVSLAGTEFEVCGVFHGGRRVGEADDQLVFIPITAADGVLSPQTVELIARGVSSDIGPSILMRDTLASWKEGGSFYSVGKLKLGAVMPLRWLALYWGVLLLLAFLRRLNARVWARLCHFVAALKTQYAIRLLPAMIGSALLALVGYALLAFAAFLLTSFSVAPLLVFTEWVPEVVVEVSSLTGRFWSLNAANAVSVRLATQPMCLVELGRGLLRWGLLAFLAGEAVRGTDWLNRRMEKEKLELER